MKIQMEIAVKSPLHLGSGQADVSLDAEVIHDEYGMPYFPAKRLKGLLYESAKEVYEMSALSGKAFFSLLELDELFQHGTNSSEQMIIHNFYLPDYQAKCASWRYLQQKYANIITAADVLEEYTEVRYQTEIDKLTGTAKDNSLHNIRVVEAGVAFNGVIEIANGTKKQKQIIALACRNLKYAGSKRNRGFGKIECTFAGIDAAINEIMREV